MRGADHGSDDRMSRTSELVFELIEIVIEGNRQRCGIGSQVIKWFLDQTPAGKVFRVCVDEDDLDTQMFLKACGIRCVATITADEDEQYLFQFLNDMEV